jgi:hypothetical protein
MSVDMEVYGGSIMVRPTHGKYTDVLNPVMVRMESGVASFQTYLTHEQAVRLGNALLALALEHEVASSQGQVGP